MNIRIRFLLLVSLSLFLSLSAIGVIVISRERTEALNALTRQGYALGDTLAAFCLANHLRGDLALITEICREVADNGSLATGENIVYLTVLDHEGRILFEKGNKILPPEINKLLNNNAAFMNEKRKRDIVESCDKVAIMDLKTKMILKEASGTERIFGAVRVGLTLSKLQERAFETYQTITFLALAALLVGMTATLFTTRKLLSEILYLGSRIRQIASGDLAPVTLLSSSGELSVLETNINSLAENLQKRELLRQYISSSTWNEIEKKVAREGTDPNKESREDGDLCKVSILFMDIRNFTALAESSASKEVVSLLNEIFGMMVDIIDTYGGVLDKFIGDALLTVFYPDDLDDDAIRAAYCAVEMQLRLDRFNQKRAFYGKDAVRAGIGINTGQVIAGSIGSKNRKDYTVIGDPVNIAARLEKRSKEGTHTHIVISEDTYKGLNGLVSVVPLEGNSIRGRKSGVTVYEIVSVKDVEEILTLLISDNQKDQEDGFRAIEARQDENAIPVLVDLLKDKDERVILRAITVLGRLGKKDERIGPVLQKIMETTKNKHVLATAIKAVSSQQSQISADFLKQFLSDSDSRVRANTIETLDQLGGEKYLKIIEPFVYDTNSRVRANASVAMWKWGRFEIGSILERLSYATNASERASSVFAAGELYRLAQRFNKSDSNSNEDTSKLLTNELAHYDKLISIIERLIGDSDAVVRKQAIAASKKTRNSRLAQSLIKELEKSDKTERDMIYDALSETDIPLPILRIIDKLKEIR
jgi:adenylate cyclase